MPAPIEQLLSRTVYATDGVTAVWDFSFSGGYLYPEHVKAYTETTSGGRTDVVLSLTGTFQATITPALAAGDKLVIYRDTPKDLPLVDFTDESGFSEVALDTNAKQAVFIAAEAADIIALSNFGAAIEAAESASSSAYAANIDANSAASSASSAAASALTAGLSAASANNSADTASSIVASLQNTGGASLVGNAPAGGIAATTVQAAINELDSEKASLTALAASSGSSLVGYMPAGAGSVATDVQSKLRESVSVKDFGAVGNGVTDDAPEINAILIEHTGGVIRGVPGATYLINTTIDIPSNTTLDLTGCYVKGGASKTGELDTLGTHFKFNSVENSALIGAKIIAPSSAFAYSGTDFYIAAVSIYAGINNTVKDCSVDLTGFYPVAGSDGIAVFGLAVNTLIENNRLELCGIRYVSGGTRFTKVLNNYINSPIANGISGSGTDAANMAYGNSVNGNMIVSPGRMGIEDFGLYTEATEIRGNTIIGSGSPTYFAMSLVSKEAKATSNNIVNWPTAYAVEIANDYGTVFSNNTIRWDDGNPNAVDGIQFNGPTTGVNASVISNNTFYGADEAIRMQLAGKAIIEGNSIQACRLAITSVLSTCKMVIRGNIINVSTQTTATRTQILAGDNSVVAFNQINYLAGFNGGLAGQDNAVVLSGSNEVMIGNIINANGYLTAGAAPYGIIAGGATGTGHRIIANQMLGGTRANYQFFTDPFVDANFVSGAIGSATNMKRAFYDLQTPIAKPAITGSRAGNAALDSLLTQLALLGLVTNSTTA